MLSQMVEYTSQPWEGEAREPTKVCSTVHVLKQSWSREVAEKEKEKRKLAKVSVPHRARETWPCHKPFFSWCMCWVLYFALTVI